MEGVLWVLTRSWELGFGAFSESLDKTGCRVTAKPKHGDWGDVTGRVNACTHLSKYTPCSLFTCSFGHSNSHASSVHLHTQTRRGPCVSSQTVKCSISRPSQGVPSAPGFVMTCTGISLPCLTCALSLLEYQADQQTIPRILRHREETRKFICGLLLFLISISYDIVKFIQKL